MTAIHTMLRASRLVVYDTEFTSWVGSLERYWSGPGEQREIVHVGAVLLDEQCAEVASFSRLARPVMNPVLSDYFVTLTGITNNDLDTRGASLSQVLEDFKEFCSGASLACSFGNDDQVIQQNCDLLGMQNPLSALTTIDVRSWLCELVQVDSADVDSARLPLMFGLPPQSKWHDGLSDARAVASVLRHVKHS